RIVAGGELTGEASDGPAEFCRAADAIAFPERNAARLSESGTHQHAVVGDVFNSPAGGTEGEDVADPRLVDHLLVEFADSAPACGAVGADHEHPEQPAVGDGAARRHREPLCAGSPGDGSL